MTKIIQIVAENRKIFSNVLSIRQEMSGIEAQRRKNTRSMPFFRCEFLIENVSKKKTSGSIRPGGKQRRLCLDRPSFYNDFVFAFSPFAFLRCRYSPRRSSTASGRCSTESARRLQVSTKFNSFSLSLVISRMAVRIVFVPSVCGHA